VKHSFRNSAGAEVLIDGKMTLRELIDAGVISIRLSKESDPLELNWWRESGAVDCEHCKGRSERDRAKCAICSGTGKVVPAHTKKVKRMVCKEGV
jgi:hypothetical protein